MKKRYYIIMILFTLIIKLFDNEQNIITKELDLKYINYIAPSLYYDDIPVVSKDIDVIDYFINNDLLYVKPVNNKMVLPISGLITKINKNYIVLSTDDGIYNIMNYNNKLVYLYQYYNSFDELGTTDDYYIIEGKNLKNIVNRLNIIYDEV